MSLMHQTVFKETIVFKTVASTNPEILVCLPTSDKWLIGWNIRLVRYQLKTMRDCMRFLSSISVTLSLFAACGSMDGCLWFPAKIYSAGS